MKIMTINAGGSSLKFSIIDTASGRQVMIGAAEGLGQPKGVFHIRCGQIDQREERHFENHNEAVEAISVFLSKYKKECPVDVIGHRVVHGGLELRFPAIITPQVLEKIEKLNELAPLHNPPAVMAIKAFSAYFKDIPSVAVFDSCFHRELPPKAYTYGLPSELSDSGIRRYGFHGIAFSCMTEQAAKIAGKPVDELKIGSLMLGSGTTANACLYGKSIDVSTGFTPLPGILQSTRTGDFDPGIIIYLQRKYGYSYNEIENIIFKKSGWLGISSNSADLQKLERDYDTDQRSHLAIDILAYSAAKYIGGYMVAMGGMDILAFGGGVGEHSPKIRKMICDYFSFLGLKIDNIKNNVTQGDGVISIEGSNIMVVVVTVREDLVIAKEAEKALR
jgi:acetate kinase